MIELFHSSETSPFARIEQIRKGCWINLLAPSEEEIHEISRVLEIDLDFLKDPLDSEERSRVEHNDNQTLVIIDIPVVEFSEQEERTDISFSTLPLGMILLPDHLITVCLKESPILEEFKGNRIRNVFTARKNQFMISLLLRTATYYMRYLKHINRKTEESEDRLHQSTKNRELFELLNLEKSLVYFTTALRSDGNVIKRLSRARAIPWTEEETEALVDVAVEFDQALEMTQTYSGILGGLMDAYASVISNNLNIVMKLLTSITIVLAIPTMVTSFFGMNVRLPFQEHPSAYVLVLGVTGILCVLSVFFLARRKLF